MMDLGGVAPVKTKTKLDFSKNNKVRVVALDFDLLTRSIEDSRTLLLEKEEQATAAATKTVKTPFPGTEKDKDKDIPGLGTSGTNMIQDMASLLNIDLPFGNNNNIPSKDKDDSETDDLSLLINNNDDTTPTKTRSTQIPTKTEPHNPKDKTTTTLKAPPTTDIRSKYATKLSQKLEGGGGGSSKSVTSLDLAKEELASNKGDAAGHFHARKLAMMDSSNHSPSQKGSKWMATTGAGTLLSFLMSRSMKIILLPIPQTNILSTQQQFIHPNIEGEGQRMKDLTQQLPNIHFHHLIPNGEDANVILDNLYTHITSIQPSFSTTSTTTENKEGKNNHYMTDDATSQVLPKHCLIVSDRDDYLKMAKEKNMFTCRIRPENARRGNITAAYNVLEMAHVENIINEINGISFNSVFGAR